MLTRIDRYLARLIFVPLLATLTLAAMLLLLDKMLRLFDFVVSEGGPVNVVWRMLMNMIPEYLALGVPIGLLMGVLLAFRRLALSSELDVLRAVGISYERLLLVPYLFALALIGVNVAIVGFVQPHAEYAYQGLRFELRSGALGASIRVGEFTNLGRRMTLRVERSEGEGHVLHNVFVRAEDRSGRSIAVTADHGSFLATRDEDRIILRLTNGRLVHNAPAYLVPRVLSFRSHDIPIDLPAIDAFRRRGVGAGIEELTLPELWRTAASAAADAEQRLAARANFHFRMAQVLMILLVPLLAVALAVPPKRSSSGLGIFLSLIFMVSYHKINQYAEQMGSLGRLDPAVAVWVPFAVAAGLILWMFRTLAHKPGGQPIGALERIFDRLGKGLSRLLDLGGARRRARRLQPAS
ncbi:MAG TPA: LPS export ABC transporter permease LptF [Allosphingosinicella sp.]|nr:LPS export ABC transporter permease LptF [Allosphingosinicella sp.]